MSISLLRSCVTGHNHKLRCTKSTYLAALDGTAQTRGSRSDEATEIAHLKAPATPAVSNGNIVYFSCPSDCPASLAEDRRLQSVQRSSIMVEDFYSMWKKRNKKHDDYLYEFKALCRLSLTSKQAQLATLPQNRSKNVNNLIIPYEHNMVKLNCTNMDVNGALDKGYINASWIDGYQHKKKYIATQGPLRQTSAEFWKMIWQSESSCIIMTTNLFEHARQQCEKYWHHIHGRYGGIDVWLETSQYTADYEIRTFRIGQLDSSRLVRQFQFQSWSETENPEVNTVLEVRRKMQAWMISHAGPITVHCSSGAGRTGTFLAIDILLDKVDAKQPLDVLSTCANLRSARPYLIESISHYLFIYEVVANYIVCGQTAVSASSLNSTVEALSQCDKNTKESGFENQLKNVNCFVRELVVAECAGGHRSENRWKSRDIMLQPPERARPYLLTHENASSTDFINAVFIDGYQRVNQFIVTQWPIKQTVNDVWRLVHDHHITVMVLLNHGERGTRKYPRFWPIEMNKQTNYGPVSITLNSDDSSNKFVRIRLFSIKKMPNAPTLHCLAFQLLQNTSNGSCAARQVALLQIQCWSNKSRVPENTHGFLDIIKLANDFSSKSGCSNASILVISRDGVSRVGPFCVVSMAIDRLVGEGEVDIFRTTERVKKNRPQLVVNLMEYIYCYTCVVILTEYYLQGNLKQIINKSKHDETAYNADKQYNVTKQSNDQNDEKKPLTISTVQLSEKCCSSPFESRLTNIAFLPMTSSPKSVDKLSPFVVIKKEGAETNKANSRNIHRCQLNPSNKTNTYEINHITLSHKRKKRNGFCNLNSMSSLSTDNAKEPQHLYNKGYKYEQWGIGGGNVRPNYSHILHSCVIGEQSTTRWRRQQPRRKLLFEQTTQRTDCKSRFCEALQGSYFGSERTRFQKRLRSSSFANIFSKSYSAAKSSIVLLSPSTTPPLSTPPQTPPSPRPCYFSARTKYPPDSSWIINGVQKRVSYV